MEENLAQSGSISDLKERAEKIIREYPENFHHIPADDIRSLIHELHVHQIELELQNEELRCAQRISEEAQRKYFELYDLAPVGYFTLDKHGQILEANLAGTALLGTERGRLLKTLFIRFIVQDDQSTFLFYRDKCIETCTQQSCELRMQTADGMLFHVQMEMISDQDDDEKEAVLKLTITNIDQLKKIEARQRLSIEILSQINQSDETKNMIRNIVLSIKDFSGVESLAVRLREGEDYPYFFTDGFSADFVRAENRLCISDANGKVLRDIKGNPILEGICGNIIRGERNDRLHPFFTPDGSFWTNSTSHFMASTLGKDRPPGTKNRCNAEGYESLALIPLRSGKEVIGLLQLSDHRKDMFASDLICFFEGIGASIGIALHRKQIMEEKERLAEQLRQFQKMQAIGTLAGGIAHDFNNMLSVILGNAELAMEGDCNWSSMYEHLAEIKKTAIRSSNIIRQIMASAQVCIGMKQIMNLEPVIRGALNVLVPENIRVQHHFSADNDQVCCDPSQIHQVLMNLIKNAADAMGDEGGVLKLELKNERLEKTAAIPSGRPGSGEYVKLSVSDTGTGIDPEITERIFDPYFTTKDVGKGSGLGLSVVRGILYSMKGKIAVDSQLGRGTTFHIWIPLAEELAEG